MSFNGTYPDSPSGKFKVIDSIGVPHPYMIGPRHVAWTADHHSGILDKHAIESAEKAGIKCEICKGKLTYDQHELALLVSTPPEGIEDNDKPELQDWLKSLLPEATQNGYVGFSFMKRKGGETE